MNYKNIQYLNNNITTIKSLSKSTMTENDEKIDKTVDELRDYLSENYENLIDDIVLKKKSIESLSAVIDDWITKNKQDTGYMKENLVKKITNNIIGYGELQPLIDDETITNIFTNENLEVLKRVKGKDIKTNIKFTSNEELENYIKAMMIRTKQKIGRDACVQDAMDILYNVRINAAISGSSIKQEVVRKPYIALRTYRVKNYNKEFFINNETFNSEIAEFLENYTLNANILIVGEPDAGKTTMIEYLRQIRKEKDPLRRIIRIEEEPELSFSSDNSVSFFERKVADNVDDIRKKYDMAEYSRIATRLAGKEVVIGETRGKEAYYLQRLIDMGYIALTSVHGSSAESGIYQIAFLESLEANNVRMDMLVQKASESFDFIIYVSHRKLIDIVEVLGYDFEKQKPIYNPIFTLKIDGDKLFWEKGKVSERFEEKKKMAELLEKRQV